MFIAIDEDLVGLRVALRGIAVLVVLANLFMRAGDQAVRLASAGR